MIRKKKNSLCFSNFWRFEGSSFFGVRRRRRKTVFGRGSSGGIKRRLRVFALVETQTHKLKHRF